jgi:hypothetical protein
MVGSRDHLLCSATILPRLAIQALGLKPTTAVQPSRAANFILHAESDLQMQDNSSHRQRSRGRPACTVATLQEEVQWMQPLCSPPIIVLEGCPKFPNVKAHCNHLTTGACRSSTVKTSAILCHKANALKGTSTTHRLAKHLASQRWAYTFGLRRSFDSSAQWYAGPPAVVCEKIEISTNDVVRLGRGASRSRWSVDRKLRTIKASKASRLPESLPLVEVLRTHLGNLGTRFPWSSANS